MNKVYPIILLAISANSNALSISLINDHYFLDREYRTTKKLDTIEEDYELSISSYSLEMPLNVNHSLFFDVSFDGFGVINNTYRISDESAKAYTLDRELRGISTTNYDNTLYSFNEQVSDIQQLRIRSLIENEFCISRNCFILKERISVGSTESEYVNAGLNNDPYNFINYSEEVDLFGSKSRTIDEYYLNYYLGFYWKNNLLSHSFRYGIDLPILDINFSTTEFFSNRFRSEAKQQKIMNVNTGVGMSIEARRRINKFQYGFSYRIIYQKSLFSKIESNYEELILSKQEIDDNVKITGISEINFEYNF